MSDVVTPALAAADAEAPLTKWTLKMPVSMPAFSSSDFSHLANVEELTGLCGFTTARNTLVLPVSWFRRASVLHSYALSIIMGHNIAFSNAGKKNSAVGFHTLDCLASPASWKITPAGEKH